MGSADLLMTVAIPGFAVILLVLVCGNVALLLFARAATRESELAVRSALGATRGRIVAQLFAEALVLGALAAVVGLAAADLAMRRWGTTFLEANMGRLPFWIDVRLSPTAVLYAIALTVLAALIAGVLPALKVTGGMGTRLRQATAGSGGLRFGGIWTAVIVTQVAFTTAFPAMVLIEQQMLVRIQTFEAGFPAEQYLAMQVEPSAADSTGTDSSAVAAAKRAVGARFVPALERLRQRVASEPGVVGVTFVDRLPRDLHGQSDIELDDDSAATARGVASAMSGGPEPFREVHTARIDAAYFDVLQAPILGGRAFQTADFVPEPRVVIVDQGFVDQVLHGRNPVGRRIRFVDRWAQAREEANPAQPWLQIVGVVKELGMGAPTERGRAAGVYLPTIPGDRGPTNMILHVRGDPMSLVPRIRALATTVDPTMRLSEFQRVDRVTDVLLWIIKLWLRLTVLLTAVALLLSLAGIYAVMSFTVSRRTREIGIRVAMGANARRVVTSIFRRPLTQVTAGVIAGAALAGAFLVFMTSCQDGVCEDSGIVTAPRVALLFVYALLILGVCLLACVVPTRRALAVQPTEALRAE
jgi:putative ABC transport system permease protein